MQTVIYKFNSYQIVKITSDEVSFSSIEEDEDFCPLSFFEQTESGREALEKFRMIES